MTKTPSDELEKVLSSEVIYRGRAVTLRRDVVELPSGRRTTREIVEHPGSVAIVPLLDNGRIVLIRQFRFATGGPIWEIPAGTLERGEKPGACAKRELEEETGYRAGKLEHLFDAFPAPGYSMELMHFYLATLLRKSEQRPEEDEIIKVKAIEPERVTKMILSNEIRDTKTICAISHLQATGRLPGTGRARRMAKVGVTRSLARTRN